MTALHVREFGAGEPVMVLHGAPTRPGHLDRLAEALAPRYRVLVPDLPGYGQSEPVQPYRLEAVHERLEQYLREHGIERVRLVGFSGGGLHAVSLACRGRVRVTALFLLGAFANLTDEESRSTVEVANLVRSGIDLRPIAIGSMLSPHGQTVPDHVAEVTTWATATTAAYLADELEAAARIADLRPSLTALGIPVVARVGSLDAACPVARSQRLVAVVPTASLEVVEGAGHALLLEGFEATLASVERLLARG